MPRDARTDASETPATPDAPCPHPHVEPHLPAVHQGGPHGERGGYHIAQGGLCQTCRRPVLRVVTLAAGRVGLERAAWALVTAPGPRVVAHGRRYG